MKRIDMSGWEMTKGSFSHSTYNAKIYKAINSSDRKEYWICNHKGFKTDTFSTYFEAILKVEKRADGQKKVEENYKTS